MRRAILGTIAQFAKFASPRRPHPAVRPERHILVDVSVVHQQDARTGIQRVVRGVLLQLLTMRIEGYVVRPVFATAKHGYRYVAIEITDASGVQFGCDEGAIDVQSGDIFLGLDLAAHILPAHRLAMRRWKAAGAHIVIVVYDLLPILKPSWFNDRMVRHFRRWLAVITDHADSVLCISAHVAQDFQHWLASQAVPGGRAIAVHQVPLGHDLAATSPSRGMPDDGEAMLAAMAAAPAMLMVGTIEPRKGYDVSLAAFEQLWAVGRDAPYSLVIVGKPGWKTADLQDRLRSHSQYGRRLFWFEQASDEFLDRLYQACNAVMVASYTEGFGLPVVEAQGYGKPALVRDVPVFREINNRNIHYFEDDSALPLSRAIASILDLRDRNVVASDQGSFTVAWQDAVKDWLVALGVREIDFEQPNSAGLSKQDKAVHH